MKKTVYIGTDAEEFQKIIRMNYAKGVRIERTKKIIEKYSARYDIKGESVNVNGCQVHIDYLPSIDCILEANERYEHAKGIIGSALYKIEKYQGICLTDCDDPNLIRVYEACRKEADTEAEKLWRLNTEEFKYEGVCVIAPVLSSAFAAVFGQTLGEWRRSLPGQEP